MSLHLWPGEVTTPSTVYEKVHVHLEDGDLVVRQKSGQVELARLPAATVTPDEVRRGERRAVRAVTADGTVWRASQTVRCGCGSSTTRPTLPDEQPT